jgi:hypothetical protein
MLRDTSKPTFASPLPMKWRGASGGLNIACNQIADAEGWYG